MSSQEYTKKRIFLNPTADDMSGTGISLDYVAATNVDVYRWGYVCSTVLDAGAFVAELNLNSPYTAADVQKQTMSLTVDKVAGDVIFANCILPVAETNGDDSLSGGVTPQTSRLNVGPAGPIRMVPGDHLEIEITTGATSGSGHGFIEIVELPFDESVDNVYDLTP